MGLDNPSFHRVKYVVPTTLNLSAIKKLLIAETIMKLSVLFFIDYLPCLYLTFYWNQNKVKKHNEQSKILLAPCFYE